MGDSLEFEDQANANRWTIAFTQTHLTMFEKPNRRKIHNKQLPWHEEDGIAAADLTGRSRPVYAV